MLFSVVVYWIVVMVQRTFSSAKCGHTLPFSSLLSNWHTLLSATLTVYPWLIVWFAAVIQIMVQRTHGQFFAITAMLCRAIVSGSTGLAESL